MSQTPQNVIFLALWRNQSSRLAYCGLFVVPHWIQGWESFSSLKSCTWIFFPYQAVGCWGRDKKKRTRIHWDFSTLFFQAVPPGGYRYLKLKVWCVRFGGGSTGRSGTCVFITHKQDRRVCLFVQWTFSVSQGTRSVPIRRLLHTNALLWPPASHTSRYPFVSEWYAPCFRPFVPISETIHNITATCSQSQWCTNSSLRQFIMSNSPSFISI